MTSTMQTNNAPLAARVKSSLLLALVFATLFLYQHWITAQAQSPSKPKAQAPNGAWVLLHSDTSVSWYNLERMDSVNFSTTNYGTRQNVSQASYTIARISGTTTDPDEIKLLHNYVQSHRLR